MGLNSAWFFDSESDCDPYSDSGFARCTGISLLPSARDRVNGTRLGVLGAEMVLNGQFGYMASVRGEKVLPVPIGNATGKLKTVSPEEYRVAKLFFK